MKKSVLRHFLEWSLMALMALLVAGCANPLVQPPNEDQANQAGNYGRAFGKLAVVEDGKPVPTFNSFSFSGKPYWFFVQSLQSCQLYRMTVEDDGKFLWALPVGDYVVAAAETVGIRTFRLWLSFTIGEPREASYVGDLDIEVNKYGFAFRVVDNYEQRAREFQPQFAKSGLTPKKGIMQAEPPLGKNTGLWSICAPKSGFPCDLRLYGVKPLAPEGTQKSYAAVSSLMPFLSWEPSPNRDFKYDLAIYESLPIGLDVPGVRKLKGRLVEYAEGLSEPKYQVQKPLKPGMKYDWSVRLREGDTVSTWTTTSYFAFLIVGWASGGGQWFGFRTPE